MRRASPLTTLATIVASAHAMAAPRVPHATSPAPQNMQQQAMPYMHPYNACTEALEGLKRTETVFPILDVSYGFADDGLSLQIDYSVFGEGRTVTLEPRAKEGTPAFKEAVEKLADLKADAANKQLRMFIYRPMMQTTALFALPPPMVALIRPDETRGTCQAVMHFPLPPAPDEQEQAENRRD